MRTLRHSCIKMYEFRLFRRLPHVYSDHSRTVVHASTTQKLRPFRKASLKIGYGKREATFLFRTGRLWVSLDFCSLSRSLVLRKAYPLR
jgi:hypothetical protein